MSNRIPTHEHLTAIAAALRAFLETIKRCQAHLDADDDITANFGAYQAMHNALCGLERCLNPGRFAWGMPARSSYHICGWPDDVMINLPQLHKIITGIIERWDVPEICDDRPMMHSEGLMITMSHQDADGNMISTSYAPRPPKKRNLEGNEARRLRHCLAGLESALGIAGAEEGDSPSGPTPKRARRGAPKSRPQTRLKCDFDSDPPHLILDGKRLTPDGNSAVAVVTYVAVLIKLDGGRMSVLEFARDHPELGITENATRFLDHIPKPVQPYIDRGKGPGPRLRVDLLRRNDAKA